MKGLISITIIFLFSFGLVFSVAFARVDLVENGTVSLEFVPTIGVYVSKAYAYKDGSELVITGKVRRLFGKFDVKGYVNIEILDPKGEILTQTTTIHIPRVFRRSGPREASFSVRLPIIPPKGATIRLGYHRFEY